MANGPDTLTLNRIKRREELIVANEREEALDTFRGFANGIAFSVAIYILVGILVVFLV